MRKRFAKRSVLAANDWIYGRQAVREALKAARRELFELHLRGTLHKSDAHEHDLALAANCGVNVLEEGPDWFEKNLGDVRHQGVALRAGPYVYRDFRALLDETMAGTEPPFWLLLDHVQDPQNLGSLLRSAEAAGVQGVLLPKDRAAGITSAVARASAGACEHMAVCRVANLAQGMETLKKAVVWLTGLERDATARPYTEIDFRMPTGLVLGSEGGGLSRLIRERCDWLAHLPMRGRVSSLNVGAAGAVAMYEVERQRRPAAPNH
jgi:23S rRNA (guanosine2251-2'-O)-methyltransferase